MTSANRICKLLLIGSIFPGGLNCAPNEKPAPPSNRSTTMPTLVIEDRIWQPPIDTRDARRTVLVCSASDSMAESIVPLKASVSAALTALTPDQNFGVIFYRGEKMDALTNGNALLPASDASKATALTMLSALKTGGADSALGAIEAAMKCDPDRIVLVASAPLEDQRQIENRLAPVNVRIDTISLGPMALDHATGLRNIAFEHMGYFDGGYARPSISGPPATNGIGPCGPMFAAGGNARRIVFICDATESMQDKLDILKAELEKTIADMRTIQSFNIIFILRNGKFQSFATDDRPLLPAVAPSKERAVQFIEMSKTTGTNPNVIHQLQHAAQQYRIITADEDIIQRTGEQIVRACQLQLNVAAWRQNFALTVEHVGQWCAQRKEKVALALVELRSDKTVFYIIPRSEQFDFDLAAEQADLDIFLNTRGAIGYAETRQIPGWEIDRFVGPQARRVWPPD